MPVRLASSSSASAPVASHWKCSTSSATSTDSAIARFFGVWNCSQSRSAVNWRMRSRSSVRLSVGWLLAAEVLMAGRLEKRGGGWRMIARRRVGGDRAVAGAAGPKLQFIPRFVPSVASPPAAPGGRATVARYTHFQENRMRFSSTFASLATFGAFATLAGCAVIVMPDDAGGVHYETAFGGSGVAGNGQHQVERRDVAEVGGLDVNGPLEVEVRVGPAPSLQLDADSNLLAMVKTDTSGDRLRIWIDGSIRSSGPVHVVYTTPRLARIDSSGSGALTVSGLNGGVLTVSQNGSRSTELSGVVAKLDVSVNGSGGVNVAGLDSGSTVASLHGSGRLDLGQVRGDVLNLEVHGSGGVRASGSAHMLNVRLHGSGSADLAGLRSDAADLATYGSGSISAGVEKTLVAETSGSGHITVYGNPAQQSVRGKFVSVVP